MTRSQNLTLWLLIVTVLIQGINGLIAQRVALKLKDRIVRLEQAISERPEQINLPALDGSPTK